MRIQRPHYLNKLIAKRGNGQVKVITGVRRCGKSFLLFKLFKDYLKENGVSESQFIELTLEEARYMRYRNPIELDNYIREQVKAIHAPCYVFIDEIQFVEEVKNPYRQDGEEKIGFVDVLLGIMKLEDVDVYITGSNSKMLSTDINTQFRGRNDEIQVFPLSFSEFRSAFPGSVEAAWEEYSIYGGMPAIARKDSHEEKSEYLHNLIERTYLQDVIQRNSIRHDESVLFSLLQVLASTAGSLINPTRIANIFKSKRKIQMSVATIEKYLKYFEEAFLIRKANRYDVKGNRYISTPFKSYFVDPGVRNAILNFRERDEGFVMENVIYIELIKRGYNVDTGSLEYNSKNAEGKSQRTQLEIDFVVNRGSKRYYIQAARDVATPAKRAQETNSLNRITDSFRKIVIVKENVIPWQDEHGITYTGIEKFLSQDDFLDIESVDSLIDMEGIQENTQIGRGGNMELKKLTLEGFAAEVEEVTNSMHPRRFCFVLGAGASKSSGIKTGQELVDIWERELQIRNAEAHNNWKKEKGITEDNRYSFYGEYYGQRFRDPYDGYSYLEKEMEGAIPSVGYVVLAYILNNTNHNVVITTNFDHLVEDAVNYYEQTFPMVIGHEALAHYISDRYLRPMIVKIHRDLLLSPKNKSQEVKELADAWKEGLEKIFSNYHPVFIGYAGNDKSLMDFLSENKERFSSGDWKYPYWMIYKHDQPSSQIREFLNAAEGYWIEHEGFDRVMVIVGDKLGYVMPTKTEYSEKALKRFEHLEESISSILTIPYKTGDEVYVSHLREDEKKEEKTVDNAMASIIKTQENSSSVLQWSQVVSAFRRGDYEEAEKTIRKLIDINPESAEYHNALGVTLHEMKRYEEALEENKRAVELEPENAKYHGGLGVTLFAMERYEEALEEVKRAIELEPENATYHNNLGATLYRMKRYEEALEETKRTIELEPENAKYHDSLGITLHKMKRYEEALEETKRAIELEPENAKYHDSLGGTLFAMERYEEALEEVKRAIELEPENEKYVNNFNLIKKKIR